jgi:hypothetical protein
MLDDKVSLSDEGVLLELDRTKVDLDGAQDRLQALTPLGAGGMVDHVRGDQVVQDRFVPRLLPSEQLFDDVPWAARVPRTHLLGPESVRSERVMPSGCPSGHCTSSMR